MVASVQPFQYVRVDDVLEWTSKREAAIASQLETLEHLVPAQMLEPAIVRFIDDTVCQLNAPMERTEGRTGPLQRMMEYIDHRRIARRRVVMYAAANGIHFQTPALQFETQIFTHPGLWRTFIEAEVRHAIQQIVRLWLDFLQLARSRVHPLYDVPIESATLLPPAEIAHGLTAVDGGDWCDQFIEMLCWNCCLLQVDIHGVLLGFITNVCERVQQTPWWSTNILAERGMIIRLVLTEQGDFVIPFGHPDDFDEHTIRPINSWPMKQHGYAWILRKLSRYAKEARLCTHQDNTHPAKLVIFRDRAEQLLVQLRETYVPESVRSLLLSVLIDGGSILYPAYSAQWIAQQIDAIFTRAWHST